MHGTAQKASQGTWHQMGREGRARLAAAHRGSLPGPPSCYGKMHPSATSNTIAISMHLPEFPKLPFNQVSEIITGMSASRL